MFGLIVTNIMVYCLNCLNGWLFICIVNGAGVSIVVVVRVVCVWFVFGACLFVLVGLLVLVVALVGSLYMLGFGFIN